MSDTAPIDVKAIRENLGLDQQTFCQRFGLPYPGFGEQGEALAKPVEVYLRMVARFPNHVQAEVEQMIAEGWQPSSGRRQ